jgi:hypothetical protein
MLLRFQRTFFFFFAFVRFHPGVRKPDSLVLYFSQQTHGRCNTMDSKIYSLYTLCIAILRSDVCLVGSDSTQLEDGCNCSMVYAVAKQQQQQQQQKQHVESPSRSYKGVLPFIWPSSCLFAMTAA